MRSDDDRENTDDEEYTVLSVPGFMTDWRSTIDAKLVCRQQCCDKRDLEAGVKVIEGMEAGDDMLGGGG
jgi:hypothetical protein